jgi:hypothetical protein
MAPLGSVWDVAAGSAAGPDVCAKLDPNSDIAQPFVDPCAAGGWPMGTDVASGSVNACVNAANLITAPLDAKVNDIARTWNPPDTFTGGQIRAVVASVYSVLDQGQSALTQAAAERGVADALLSDIASELKIVADHRAQAELYLQAAQQADSSGNPVKAPNFKQWILNAMNEGSSAITVAYTVGCVTPWWASIFQAFSLAFDSLYALLKTVTGIAVKVGAAVVNAVEGAATVLAFGARILLFVTSYWPLLLLAAIGTGYAYYRKKSYGRVFPQGFIRDHGPGFLFPKAPR